MREGKSVTLTLKVSGDIEDRGEIGDLTGFFGLTDDLPSDTLEFDIDTVGYMFALSTSYESYSVTYVNEECQVTYTSDLETVNLSEEDFSVTGNTLTISFEVNTTNETYESISVFTYYMKLKFSLSDLEEMDEEDLEDLMVILTDQAPNDPLEAYATVTNLGEAGKEVEFEGFAMYGQPLYEYQWEFGDGSTSPKKSPTHIYDEPGEYEYTFTVTDNSGASASYSDTIEISGDAGDDEGIPIIMFVVVIVIIASIGIIALVYIIRR